MTTIHRVNTSLARAPALLSFRDDPSDAINRGTILFYHGFSASKEDQHKEFDSLARCGYMVVGIDNVGHGERRYPDFDIRFNPANQSQWEPLLLESVYATVDEVPTVIDALLERELARPDRIGVAGISMGGHITYGAILQDRRIRVATPILGSPGWRSERSPHRHLDAFYPVALLSQNAAKDQNVPAGFARRLHRELEPYYMEAPERLAFVEFPESGHFMVEHEWNRLWQNVLDWFERFLK